MSPKYSQHSAHIAPGRDGLFALIRSVPQTLRYENQLIVAEGDHIMAHGRFVVRFEDGLLTEHWDVIQDEATQAESVSGLPMFGDRFPRNDSSSPRLPRMKARTEGDEGRDPQ